MEKKLFIWSLEYDVLLSLAETVEEARTNIILESLYKTDVWDPTYDEEEFYEILNKEPIILETGAMILSHSNA